MKWTTLFAGVAVLTAATAIRAGAAPAAPAVEPHDAMPTLVQPSLAKVAAPRLATSCLDQPNAAPIPIAASVSNGMYGYSAGEQVVQFSSIVTNEGSQWNAGSHGFVAVCPGLYVFTVSANTDVYYQSQCGFSAGRYGTDDDVNVRLKLTPNGGSPGDIKNKAGAVDPGANAGAWIGEQVDPSDAYGYKDRGQASYTVALRLNSNDVIQAFVTSDGNKDRCLARVNLTAYRLAK